MSLPVMVEAMDENRFGLTNKIEWNFESLKKRQAYKCL
jgi:hypothetical protein